MGEQLTAVQYGMNITHVLVNNNELGKITKEQRAGEVEVWKTDLHNPSFAAYAKICNAWGKRVTDPAKLDETIAEAIAHDGPSLVEIVADVELI